MVIEVVRRIVGPDRELRALCAVAVCARSEGNLLLAFHPGKRGRTDRRSNAWVPARIVRPNSLGADLT
jgi:hypothetical protein